MILSRLMPLTVAVMSLVAAFVSRSEETFPSPPSWPQFRGPNASGVAPLATPPTKIGPTENVLWKTKIPWSPSSPSIWAQRIFLSTFDQGELQVRAYDRDTGRLLWKKGVQPGELEVFHRSDGSPAASTCTTDGKHVVTYFGSFGLICHDMDGHEIWRHPMPVARSLGQFGTGTSPIIAGRTVVLLRDERNGSKLIALDVSNGSILWESPRPDSIGGFGSPIVWDHNGSKQLITPGSSHLKGYALDSGRETWVVKGTSRLACTTPVLGNNQLYFGAWSPGGLDNPWPDWAEFHPPHDKNGDGIIELSELPEEQRDFFRGIDVDEDGDIDQEDWKYLKNGGTKAANMLIAVQPGGQGDITDTHVPWIFKKGLPYVPSPLFYQGRIYMIKDGGLMSSIDAESGKPHYAQERIQAGGSYYASPVAANGHIYLASLNGQFTVVKAGGDLPEILHQSDFDERIFATPALVGDKLYLRTESTLYAFGNPDE